MPTINKPKKKNYPKHGKQLDIYKTVYNTHRWRLMRDKYLMMHPLCERCLRNDEYNAATEVHHNKPLSTAETEMTLKYLGFSYENLEALCEKCHHEVHNRMRKKF